MKVVPFRKHISRDGVLARTLTADQVAEEKRQEEAEEKRAQEKASARWRKPIPVMDWPTIERLALKNGAGLGGEIVDVISDVEDQVTAASGRIYATRVLLLHVEFKMEGIAPDAKAVSDGITVVIYRDPNRPKKFRLAFGRMEVVRDQEELNADQPKQS